MTLVATPSSSVIFLSLMARSSISRIDSEVKQRPSRFLYPGWASPRAALRRIDDAPATELLELASLPTSSSPAKVPATLVERERERCASRRSRRRAARLARLSREARLPASDSLPSSGWISSWASSRGGAGTWAGALGAIE